jgi:sterol-4alpha-carboxylate 3-dehydrogenase (decarboxylating)
MAGLWEVYEGHKTHFQIGDNNNLFDYTYVGNVAKAHLLAADKLETPAPAPALTALGKQPVSLDEVPDLTDAENDIVSGPLPPITATLGHHQIPTSFSRPLGPYVSRPENGDELEANWNDGITEEASRPVIRTRFDPLAATSIKRAKVANPDSHPLQVAGQIFFITNGEPVPFWDFHRGVYVRLDKKLPGYRTPRGIFKLPRPVGFAAAQGSEWFAMLTGKTPTFTKFRVTFATATRWHNIEKARRVLGYEPDVGLEEGIDKMVEVRVRSVPPNSIN